MADINLLPVEDKSVENLTDLQKKATLASVAILLITSIATVATLVAFTFFAGERNRINAQISESSGRIERLKPVEDLLAVASKKAISAQKALELRFNYNKFFDGFSALVPQGVYFGDIKITGSKLTLSGKARSSADIAGLVSSIVSEDGQNVLIGANMESLSSDEKGVYTFSMSAEVVQKASKGEEK